MSLCFIGLLFTHITSRQDSSSRLRSDIPRHIPRHPPGIPPRHPPYNTLFFTATMGAIAAFECVWWFLKRVYLGGTNQRNVFTLALNFCVNFSPVFLWLFMFKNAGVIPNSWRSHIWGSLAYYLDNYMFGDFWHSLDSETQFWFSLFTSSVVCVLCIGLPLLAWYYIYFRKRAKFNVFDDTDFLTQNPSNGIARVQFSPSRLRILLPFAFPAFMFLVLNIDNLLASQDERNFTRFKDILAWVLYVILHLTAPILTGVYLYVFHAPGTLKCFSFALGLQNIAGLCTHMLLPMAPPWFVHMYGAHDKEHLNYQQQGYAAGLTRVDMHLGTHLNSNGFHLSPIVFGAVPSLHSAIAVQCFFFLMFRSTFTKSVPESISHGNGIDNDDEKTTTTTTNKDDDDDEYYYQPQGPLTKSTQGTSEGTPESQELTPSGTPAIIPFEFEEDEDVDQDKFGTLGSFRAYDSDDMERLISSDSDSEVSPENLVQALAAQQKLPLHILQSKWLYVFHKGWVPKFLGTVFVCMQWWSTQYLDHHFRFDLFVGAIYASISYIVINKYVLQPKVIKPWLLVRADPSKDTKNESRTMGMRVFAGTSAEWFFDPLK